MSYRRALGEGAPTAPVDISQTSAAVQAAFAEQKEKFIQLTVAAGAAGLLLGAFIGGATGVAAGRGGRR